MFCGEALPQSKAHCIQNCRCWLLTWLSRNSADRFNNQSFEINLPETAIEWSPHGMAMPPLFLGQRRATHLSFFKLCTKKFTNFTMDLVDKSGRSLRWRVPKSYPAQSANQRNANLPKINTLRITVYPNLCPFACSCRSCLPGSLHALSKCSPSISGRRLPQSPSHMISTQSRSLPSSWEMCTDKHELRWLNNLAVSRSWRT